MEVERFKDGRRKFCRDCGRSKDVLILTESMMALTQYTTFYQDGNDREICFHCFVKDDIKR